MPRFPKSLSGALALVVAASAPTMAQRLQPQGGVAWGRTLPVEAYHAVANGQGFQSASQGMVFFALERPGSALGIRLDGFYTKNPGNDSLNAALTTALGQTTTEQAKLIGANLDVTYTFRLGPGLRPYVLGGLGLHHVAIAVTSGSATSNNSATKPALNVGAGMSYRIGPVAPFLEARYVAVAAVPGFPRTTFVPIVLGLGFGGGR